MEMAILPRRWVPEFGVDTPGETALVLHVNSTPAQKGKTMKHYLSMMIIDLRAIRLTRCTVPKEP